MIIKKPDKTAIFKKNFGLSEKISRKRLLYALLLILFFTLGYFSPGPSIIKNYASKLASYDSEYFNNYLIGKLSHPPKIQIDINHKHFQHLAFKRQKALEKGYLVAEEDSYVPARITADGRTAKVHIRLKGEVTDHLQGKKWSYRIKVRKDKTIFGMRFFSLQSPERSGWVHEWILYRWFKKEGLIALRYDFVDLIVNGKNMGIYTLEESFSKELIENNKRREGPILKFDDSYIADKSKMNIGDRLNEADIFYASDITTFSTNKTYADETLRNSYLTARKKLNAVRNREMSFSEVFDVNQAARVIAILQISNVLHGMRWKNCRFYANPVTQKIELIAYNAFSTHPVVPLDKAGHIFYNIITDDIRRDGQYKWLHLFMEDETFLTAYFSALDRLTTPEYLNGFFKEIKTELEEKESFLFTEYPEQKSLIPNYYRNSKILRRFLYPKLPPKTYVNNDPGERLMLNVANTAFLPIVLDGIVDTKTGQVIGSVSPSYIDGKISEQPLKYVTVESILPGMDYAALDKVREGDVFVLNGLRLKYHVLGVDSARTTPIEAFPSLLEGIDNRATLSLPDRNHYQGISIDARTGIIRFAEGDYRITTNMIIPQGYRLILDPGVRLTLDQSAAIIAYGPTTINGTSSKEVVISSEDGTGQGFCMINAKGPSVWQHVVFENLGAVNRQTWQLTGAVTIYESEIDISNLVFRQNHSEDQLNIIRSSFEIRDAIFLDNHADSLDIDFCTGTINRIEFQDCQNDCIDFSGSEISVDRLIVKNAGDKGVSVGEKSMVTLTNSEITGARIGIAGKDLSTVTINNVRISGSDIGIAVYQKKREFGGAKAILNNVAIDGTNYRHIRDKDSLITENGRPVNIQPMMIRETGEISEAANNNEQPALSGGM